MEIRKSDSMQRLDSTMSGFDSETEAKIVGAIAAMHANLHTFGKPWSPAVGQGWLMALRASEDIGASEFLGACVWFIANRKDFPAPSEVLERVREGREDKALKAALIAGVEHADEQDDARMRAKFLEHFGTEDPVREQIKAWVSGMGIEEVLQNSAIVRYSEGSTFKRLTAKRQMIAASQPEVNEEEVRAKQARIEEFKRGNW